MFDWQTDGWSGFLAYKAAHSVSGAGLAGGLPGLGAANAVEPSVTTQPLLWQQAADCSARGPAPGRAARGEGSEPP